MSRETEPTTPHRLSQLLAGKLVQHSAHPAERSSFSGGAYMKLSYAVEGFRYRERANALHLVDLAAAAGLLEASLLLQGTS